MSGQLPIVPLDVLPPMPWSDKLAYLAWKFSQMEQVRCPLTHLFEDGVYIREIFIPAGVLFVGRVHRHGHRVELVSGEGVLVTEHAKIPVRPPYAIETGPSGQVAFYAITDVVGRTIHPNPTQSQDAQALEDDIFEPAEQLYRLGNSVEQRIHYLAMIRHHGVDEELLARLVEDPSDQIPFPEAVPVDVKPSYIDRQGIVATADVDSGVVIAPARVGGKRTPAGRFTNHSSRPNAEMVNVGGDVMLVAIDRIPAGMEVTVDYRQAVQAGAQT